MKAVLVSLALLVTPSWTFQETQAPSQAYGKSDQTASSVTATTEASFSSEQLEQIVAPIALYPDALLAQILMGSTYPLEIVEAARWVQKNPKLAGEALEAALKDKTWDPAVKSLCGFGDVLNRMSENLDWTQDLGDAYLSQQAELMASVQTMRRKAYESGNLNSSNELTVTAEVDTIIVIEAADPEVIYVPTYYPTAVYPGWSYPYWYYPPLYPPPPASGVWFGFSVGIVWGAAIWGDCDWNNSEIDIDIDHHHDFADRTEWPDRAEEVKQRAGTRDQAGAKGTWKHDPSHRKGVSYKSPQTASKFGGAAGQTRVSRDQARGYADSAAPSAAQRNTPAARDTGARAAQRPESSASPRSSGQRSGSFSGSRSPGLDRAGSSRGATSRGSTGSRGGRGRG